MCPLDRAYTRPLSGFKVVQIWVKDKMGIKDAVKKNLKHLYISYNKQ